MVLEAGTCTHDRALAGGAELGDRAVEDVQVVEEVDRVDSKPLLKDLALREADSDAQVAAAKRCISKLAQLAVSMYALLACTLGATGPQRWPCAVSFDAPEHRRHDSA